MPHAIFMIFLASLVASMFFGYRAGKLASYERQRNFLCCLPCSTVATLTFGFLAVWFDPSVAILSIPAMTLLFVSPLLAPVISFWCGRRDRKKKTEERSQELDERERIARRESNLPFHH